MPCIHITIYSSIHWTSESKHSTPSQEHSWLWGLDHLQSFKLKEKGALLCTAENFMNYTCPCFSWSFILCAAKYNQHSREENSCSRSEYIKQHMQRRHNILPPWNHENFWKEAASSVLQQFHNKTQIQPFSRRQVTEIHNFLLFQNAT